MFFLSIWRFDRDVSVHADRLIIVSVKRDVGPHVRMKVLVITLILTISLINWMICEWTKENKVKNTKIK